MDHRQHCRASRTFLVALPKDAKVLLPTVLRSRLARVVAMLLACGILASPHSWSEPAAAATHPSPLDLAAMILTPADLARAGLEDYGGSSGRMLTIDDLAARVVWPEGDGERLVAARDALLAEGWSQAQA